MNAMKFEIVPLKWQNNEWKFVGESYGEYPKTAKQALERAKHLAKRDRIAVRVIVCDTEEGYSSYIGDCQVNPDSTIEYCMGNGIVPDSTIQRMFGLRK